MGKIRGGMTMSLDGFVNDKDGSVSRLYPDMAALQSTDVLQTAIRDTGAVVMGRRSYEMGGGDFTGYEFQVPIFVLTHAAPETVAQGENEQLRFTFVAEGVERAAALARAAAGERDVTVIGGAQTVRQFLAAGLLDELEVTIAPVLLGAGLRLFDDLGPEPIALEQIRAAEYPTFTCLLFRVVR